MWFSGVADEEIFLSVLVVGEIRRGVEAIRRRDPRHAALLEHWLKRLVVDTLLAATARVHGLTLATRNVRDVAWTGVDCINPFEGRLQS